MTEPTNSTNDAADASPEVEAHSVLDFQTLGKNLDTSGMWTCLSNISAANEEF
jgi:hypothetical protein